MRVMFVVTGLLVGGAEMALFNLLARMDRQRYELHVISLAGAGPVGDRILALGVAVTVLDFRRRPLASSLALLRVMRRWHPDIVQTWMYHGDVIGGVAARLAGVGTIVWSIHNTLLDAAAPVSTRAMVWLGARLSALVPAAVVSCSRMGKDVHQAIGYAPDRFRIIGNGVDLNVFKPDPGARTAVRAELTLPVDARIVLHVARFHPQKDHATLLRAACETLQQSSDVWFVLAGKGVDRTNPALVEVAAHKRFRLLGLRHDTPRLMAAADVLVLSSMAEAFPVVLAEAMACGTPCVATEAGDSRLIVGRLGATVPIGDASALAGAMTRVLGLSDDATERLRNDTRQYAQRTFDICGVARQYEALYEELWAKHHSPT